MLTQLGVDKNFLFHHDGFEFNNGNCPPLNFDPIPRMRLLSDGNRVVYLERDPRDVMVSLFHQVTGRFNDFFNYDGDISAFIRDPYFGAGNLARFRSMWHEFRSWPNVHFTTYEEFHRDCFHALSAVLDFANLQIPNTSIQRAVNASTVETMREVEQSGTFPQPWLRPRNGHPKVRLGRSGTFANILTTDDILYLNEVFRFRTEST